MFDCAAEISAEQMAIYILFIDYDLVTVFRSIITKIAAMRNSFRREFEFLRLKCQKNSEKLLAFSVKVVYNEGKVVKSAKKW